jgi:hypothetical protein
MVNRMEAVFVGEDYEQEHQDCGHRTAAPAPPGHECHEQGSNACEPR